MCVWGGGGGGREGGEGTSFRTFYILRCVTRPYWEKQNLNFFSVCVNHDAVTLVKVNVS